MALTLWQAEGVRALALLLIMLTTLPFGPGAVRALLQNEQTAQAEQADAPCHGCDDDKDDCSPVCPDCVGSFATRLLMPRSPLVVAAVIATPWAVVSDREPAPTMAIDGPPRAPPSAGVFHPPRA